MARNAGLIGKNMSLNGTTKIGMYDLDDLHFNMLDTSFGFGYLYAQSYVAATGGTLTVYSGGSDISATLDSYADSTSGDALFLPNGIYTVDSSYSSQFKPGHTSMVFPQGYYGVFGGDPDKVMIKAESDAGVNYTDNAIVSWSNAGDIKLDVGYLTLKIKSFGNSTTSYAQVLFAGTGTTDLTYCQLKNVAINKNGQNFSFLYDNNSDAGYIWLKNCSIGNTATLYNNYSGNKSNKDLFNVLADANLTTTQVGTLTDCVVNGSYLSSDASGYLSYDTATYSTAGHLYDLENTTWSVPT